jgi:hypothetical protein
MVRAPSGPWASEAAGLLANLGFTLLNSDQPAAAGGSQLLVALRAQPSLRHFDPELINCWVAAAGRGRALPIDRRTAPGDRSILWGHLHVSDRLRVENRFLTFGGRLEVADVTPQLRVVRHVSPGPVVRWGGHSQGLDLLAGEIGAFFGRLIVPVDYLPGGEARLSAEPPEHLYAAFLRDAAARRRDARRRLRRQAFDPDRGDPLGPWIGHEIDRVRATQPDWWSAGGCLLDDLDLGPEGFASERAAALERGAASKPAPEPAGSERR